MAARLVWLLAMGTCTCLICRGKAAVLGLTEADSMEESESLELLLDESAVLPAGMEPYPAAATWKSIVVGCK